MFSGRPARKSQFLNDFLNEKRNFSKKNRAGFFSLKCRLKGAPPKAGPPGHRVEC